MHRWMHGKTDGRRKKLADCTDGRTDKGTDGGRKDGSTYVLMDGQADRVADGWTVGWTGEPLNEGT